MSGRFDAVDQGRIEPIRAWPTLALDVAQSSDAPLRLPIAGTALYLTSDSTGKIYLRFNDKDAARIPAQGDFAISNMLYRAVSVDWAAQAGKVAQIVYGTGLQVAPSNDISSIGMIINPVQVSAGTFSSHLYAVIASAALQTLITPAANTGGIKIYGVTTQAGTGISVRMMYKASAPASFDDTAAGTIQWSDQSVVHTTLALPIVVPAGQGVYFQSSGAINSRYGLEYEAL